MTLLHDPRPRHLRRPWRERVPKLPKPDVVVVGGIQPLATLTIYTDMVLHTRRDEHGHVRQYPINPAALAQVLSHVPSCSGLLPPNTLGTGRINGEPFYVLYISPSLRTLRTPDSSYTFPLPPLVFGGRGSDYRIWALGEPDYPTGECSLFDPPFPNSYRDGGICWGNVEGRPLASSKALLPVLDMFLTSYFNLHVANAKSVQYQTSILARWQQLDRDGDEAYPLDDLIPAERSLSWLLGGGPWTGAAARAPAQPDNFGGDRRPYELEGLDDEEEGDEDDDIDAFTDE